MLNEFKTSFIRLALDCQVLKFGKFKLKSGRISPYFFNAGMFYQGEALRQLGYFYAKTLLDNQAKIQHLFGPAYKGFPLATSTAIALAELGVHVTVSFNRKEVKDHGEGGALIGSPLSGNTIIVDDVISAGTAFRESQSFIQSHGGKLCGVIIALDRCEKGLDEQSAIRDITAQGIPVYSIVTLFDLMTYLKQNGQQHAVDCLDAYYRQYGA